jgi:hypothetical protein
MSPDERQVSFKESRLPRNGHAGTGVEMLDYEFLRPLRVHDPNRTLARIGEELRKGRIVSTFANMTLLVLGPHDDSPYVHSFDEDMKRYNAAWPERPTMRLTFSMSLFCFPHPASCPLLCTTPSS